MMFGTSDEEAVKGVSKWAASKFILQTANVTCSLYSSLASHQNFKVNPAGDNQMSKLKWGRGLRCMVNPSDNKMEQDNAMDRVGTLSLNLYKTEMALKPANLNSL